MVSSDRTDPAAQPSDPKATTARPSEARPSDAPPAARTEAERPSQGSEREERDSGPRADVERTVTEAEEPGRDAPPGPIRELQERIDESVGGAAGGPGG